MTSTATITAAPRARLRLVSTMRRRAGEGRHRVGAAEAEIGMIGDRPDLAQHPPAALALLAGCRDDAHGDPGDVLQGEGAVRRRALAQRAGRGDADLGEIDAGDGVEI